MGEVHWSQLSSILESPLHYARALEEPRVPSAAMRLGTLVHAMVLEPDAVADRHTAMPRYAVMPNFGDLRSRLAREARDQWRAENGGAEVYTLDEWERAKRISDAVRANPCAARLLDLSVARELEWRGEIDGITAAGRVDLLTRDTGSVILSDLKTCRSAAPALFGAEAARRMYHAQLAWYARGLRSAGHDVDTLALIAVETVEPYDCVVYTLSDEDWHAGDLLVDEALARYRECSEAGMWPGRGGVGGRMDLRLPKWARADDETESLGLDWESDNG